MKGKAGIIVLAGLGLFLSACEKDMPGKAGNKVAINFLIGSSASEAPRGFDLGEPERVALEIENEEDYFLSATLAPDEEGLRAVTTSALVEGQKVHLEAYYTSSGVLAGEADYHANSAGWLVLDDPDSPLEVDPTLGPYDFSAYSYYKSTASISTTGIDPRTDDLIWGNITNQPITATEAGRTVSFNLKHKFSQVRVRISVGKIAGATITDIGTVMIESQKTVDLTVKDGAIADNSDVGALDVSSSLATTNNITLTSDYFVFYPSPTEVTISYIKIKVGSVETTYNDLSTTFTEGVTAGGNYTLAVDIVKYDFAQSNIYWDGERLTFDKAGVIPESRYYNGVNFKWGSLVGVSPGHSDHKLYKPNVGDGTWSAEAVSISPYNWVSMIEPAVATSSYQNVWNKNYPYDYPDFSNLKGDICSYLTDGAWRVPTSYDYDKGTYHGIVWEEDIVTTDPIADGTGMVSHREYVTTASSSMFIPVSGHRSYGGGYIAAGAGIHYWTGSANSSTNGSHLSHAFGYSVDVFYTYDSHYGLPIRCIKAN
jgi:hypothetical protein